MICVFLGSPQSGIVVLRGCAAGSLAVLMSRGAQAYQLLPVTYAGARSRTVRLRAPWAPWMITPSMSPVADGPARNTP